MRAASNHWMKLLAPIHRKGTRPKRRGRKASLVRFEALESRVLLSTFSLPNGSNVAAAQDYFAIEQNNPIDYSEPMSSTSGADGFHHFTTDSGEVKILVSLGYIDESKSAAGLAVLNNYIAGSAPIHRMYNPNNGQHYYTYRDIERDYLITVGWNYERDEGFIYTTAIGKAAEVFLLYNNIGGEHLFTTDPSEKNAILAKFLSWEQQTSFGFAFSVPALGSATSSPASSSAIAQESAGPNPAGSGNPPPLAPINGISSAAAPASAMLSAGTMPLQIPAPAGASGVLRLPAATAPDEQESDQIAGLVFSPT